MKKLLKELLEEGQELQELKERMTQTQAWLNNALLNCMDDSECDPTSVTYPGRRSREQAIRRERELKLIKEAGEELRQINDKIRRLEKDKEKMLPSYKHGQQKKKQEENYLQKGRDEKKRQTIKRHTQIQKLWDEARKDHPKMNKTSIACIVAKKYIKINPQEKPKETEAAGIKRLTGTIRRLPFAK